jgi:ribose transport system permease protein
MAPKNSWLKALRLQKVTGVVVLVVLIILFSAISPHLFATVYTLRTVLNEQAVTVAIAVALLIPFAAGAFDLSIGYTMGLGALLSAYLMADKGLPVGVAVVLTLVAGALIGIVN